MTARADTEVTKCWACPFNVTDSLQNDPACHAPNPSAETYHPSLVGEPDAPPDWCPLRKGPITIRLK